ncbi:MAG: methyltransferase [Firmicutes bacterium]|nr:methyltransferase [Bacillota bacterium]
MSTLDNQTVISLGRGLRLWQDRRFFGFAEDTAALAAMIGHCPTARRICELGSGSGGLTLLLAMANPQAECTGLELMPANTALARRSLLLNAGIPGLRRRCHFIQGDLRRAGDILAPGTFDILAANPPWQPRRTGRISPIPERAAAKSEIFCTLAEVISAAALLLRPGGDFFLILPQTRRGEAESLLQNTGFTIIRHTAHGTRLLWQARLDTGGEY